MWKMVNLWRNEKANESTGKRLGCNLAERSFLYRTEGLNETQRTTVIFCVAKCESLAL